MKKAKIILVICSIGLIFVLIFMTIGGSGNNDDDINGNFSIPVDKSSEYTYNSTRDGDQSYTLSEFKVEVENNTYTVNRIDDVANPGTSLEVKNARVVGSTMVIEEKFVDTTDSNIAAPSVISTSGYEESWELDLDINTIAIEHPYGENPYVKNLD